MKNQIKRLAAPKTWPIERKVKTWVAKPHPGAHKLEHSLALSVIIRDILKLAETAREAKRIIKKGEIFINGNQIKEMQYDVGLYDVIFIPKLKQNYRILLTKNQKLVIQLIPEEESQILPLQIKGKTILRKNMQQVNFSNGWNLIDKNKYSLYDTALFNLKSKKIIKHIPLKEGCSIIAISGKNAGQVGSLQKIVSEGTIIKRKLAKIKTGQEEWQTTLENLFVVGEKSPEFTAEAR